MKNEKLRIENFLNNELKNQTKIVGGSFGPGIIIDPPFQGGGPAVVGGNGGGDIEDPIGIGNPPPKVDPNKM
jgi:hypothetical protein